MPGILDTRDFYETPHNRLEETKTELQNKGETDRNENYPTLVSKSFHSNLFFELLIALHLHARKLTCCNDGTTRVKLNVNDIGQHEEIAQLTV